MIQKSWPTRQVANLFNNNNKIKFNITSILFRASFTNGPKVLGPLNLDEGEIKFITGFI